MLDPDSKLFLIQRSCERGHLDWHELVDAAKVGLAQIHETDNGVAITSISKSGPWSTCIILALAGNSKGISELKQKIELFAYNSGCNLVRLDARQGFELKRKGGNTDYQEAMADYKAVAIVYEKVIQEPHNAVTQAASGSNDAN